MIDYIKGNVAELSPTEAVVEACGVGYKMAISLNTYSAVQGNDVVKLYVTEVIREDAHLLYGFCTKAERELFELLISISGVGGQTARMILSAYSPTELSMIISSGDSGKLKMVKGIGPKAAQRIIVELKDRITTELSGVSTDGGAVPAKPQDNGAAKEAVAALAMLGFAPAPTHKVVTKIVEAEPEITVEEIIKRALKML